MLRHIAFFLIILLLNIIQISFINLTDSVARLNILILFLVFLVFYFEEIPLLWWSLITGAVGELFSPYPFGMITVIIIVTAIALMFLFNNFLTNRSLYTFLLLSIAGTVIYNLLLLIVSYLFYLFNTSNLHLLDGRELWIGLSWQTIINAFAALSIFFATRPITNKFQKLFLDLKGK